MSSHNGGTNGHHGQSPPAPVEEPMEEGAENTRPQMHPVKKVHLLLRGRYKWAILLGGLLAVLGGVGGWFAITPMRQATGQVAIRTFIPKVLKGASGETGLMPMANKFIANQVVLMTSPRVINQAMASDQWQDYSRGMSPAAKDAFEEKLAVFRPRGTDAITVEFVHQNGEAAEAAVQAVIRAYQQVFQERDVREGQNRMNVLENRRNALMSDISSLNSRIQNVAGQYGPKTLERMFNHQIEQVQNLENALQQSELALTSSGVSLDGGGANGAGSASAAGGGQQAGGSIGREASQWRNLSVREIARMDERMGSLVQMRSRLEQQLASLKMRFGENHRRVQEVASQLESVQQSIDQYAQVVRVQGPAGSGSSGGVSPGLGLGLSNGLRGQMSVQQLRTQRRQLQRSIEQAKQRMQQLGQKQSQVDDLQQQRQQVQAKLEQITSRIDRLNVESSASVSGRLVINNKGHLQTGIVNSGTRKQLALFGATLGGALGVGLIMMLGWRDQRMYSVDDMSMFRDQPRMLGMLPNLPRDLTEPQNAMLAAYAVHHIRSMLQLATPHATGRTLAVVGPARHTGKTSLTLGLGLSFAAAGSRTLLIDCDLVGGGLSRRLQTFIRRRLGQILEREGTISREQLEGALNAAEAENKKLGQVLLERGDIDESTLAHALDTQEHQSVGLLDAMAGEPLDQCVARSGLDNLSLLPIGDAGAEDTSRLSPKGLQDLVHAARQQFEVVLIDTGPMPGSVESSIAAGVADEAVMVISRGDQRATSEEALSTLRSIRVPVAGVVFNRAHQRDLERSARSQSRFSAPASHHEAPPNAERLRTDRFDPLTRAVAEAATGQHHEHDHETPERAGKHKSKHNGDK